MQRGGGRRRVIDHGVADRRCDLIVGCIGEANVQDGAGIVAGHIDGAVNGLEHVLLHQPPLAQHTHAGAVPVEQVAMLCQLGEFDFCHVHQGIDFIFRALEILDAESVDGHHFDAGFVAHFENLEQLASKFLAFVLKTPKTWAKGKKVRILTLASASKPRLCPSSVSIL